MEVFITMPHTEWPKGNIRVFAALEDATKDCKSPYDRTWLTFTVLKFCSTCHQQVDKR